MSMRDELKQAYAEIGRLKGLLGTNDTESVEKERERMRAQRYLHWVTVQAHLESVMHDIAMHWPNMDVLQTFKEVDWHGVSYMKQSAKEIIRMADELERYRYGVVDSDREQSEVSVLNNL